MSNVKIRIKLVEGGKLPEYKTAGASAMDCYARLDEPVVVFPRTCQMVPLGFAVELPMGWEMQVRPRSSLGVKETALGIFGTVDSDYRGEVCAVIYNGGIEPFRIVPGDRLCQVVAMESPHILWEEVKELSQTARGEGGFGSTGRQ